MHTQSMDTKHLEGKRVFWSNKWDKIWLLIIPTILLIDIFTPGKYSTFWFWTILICAGAFNIYVLYHMFHPKFAWVDPTTTQGKKIQEKAFELLCNDTGNFQYSPDGFEFTINNQKQTVNWADIESIFAYKRDLYTVDELDLDIFTNNGFKLHLTEECPGWYQFILKLKEIFPSIDKEFDVKLMFPPFDTNLTLVYDSKGRTLDEVKGDYSKD